MPNQRSGSRGLLASPVVDVLFALGVLDSCCCLCLSDKVLESDANPGSDFSEALGSSKSEMMANTGLASSLGEEESLSVTLLALHQL